MDSEKILFLDFDGPMIPTRAWVLQASKSCDTFDPVAAETVRHVVEAADAQIVVTSTHRIRGYDHCVRMMEHANLSRSLLHSDWCTDRVADGASLNRKLEIALWLSKHPSVKHYVILDDEDVGLPNLVRVSTENGVMLSEQRRLFEIFEI